MLLGFKRRFAPYVLDGSKTHTIRAIRKITPKVGEMCHCYVDPRQKTMKLLGRWPCVKVETIAFRVAAGRNWPVLVWVGKEQLSCDECNALAWRDGFRDRGHNHALEEMLEFWKGRLPFDGYLIHWRYWQVGPVGRGPASTGARATSVRQSKSKGRS